MPNLEYFAPVNASLQTIWEVLLDRIEHPERYLQGVSEVSFPDNTEDYAIREMQLGGVPLKEKITLNDRQGEIRYELLEHPLFEGEVVNALIPPAPDDPKALPVVQFRMHWQPRNNEAAVLEAQVKDDLEESIRQGVHFVRDLAEHREKQKTGA